MNIKETVAARASRYGSPDVNFANCANLWSRWLGATRGVELCLSAKDVAVMMILLKTSRLMAGTWDRDTVIDIGGYAECLDQILDLETPL